MKFIFISLDTILNKYNLNSTTKIKKKMLFTNAGVMILNSTVHLLIFHGLMT